MHVLSILAIAVGAAILLYSLFLYYKALVDLKKHMGSDRLFSEWIYLACAIMILFFFAGYILNLVISIRKTYATSQDLLIAAVFFSGSVFVYAMVSMARRMFNTICAKALLNEQYIQLRELKDELIKAKESAELSSKSKSELLSRASHEMLTAVNVINSMTDVGLSIGYVNQKDNCLNKIKNASAKLLAIINDLLDISSIESDSLKPEFKNFSPAGMLKKTASAFESRIADKQLQFNMDVDNDVPQSIRSDERRLAQVVGNLLSNSIKFTKPNGAISLSVTGRPEGDGRFRLRFEIDDNGAGISEEDQAKLFSLFEHADGGGTAGKQGGIGLSLAISKRIVEMLGGAITVSSTVGQGTSVVFDVLTEAVNQAN